MLKRQIKGHASNPELVQQILSAVEEMIRGSQLRVEMAEYHDMITLEKGRPPLATGKNTIIIACDGGSPEVDIMVDSGDCCGG